MSNPVSYSVYEAAKATEIPAATIREFIKRGELLAARIGRKQVIRREALDAWIKSYERRGLLDHE